MQRPGAEVPQPSGHRYSTGVGERSPTPPAHMPSSLSLPSYSGRAAGEWGEGKQRAPLLQPPRPPESLVCTAVLFQHKQILETSHRPSRCSGERNPRRRLPTSRRCVQGAPAPAGKGGAKGSLRSVIRLPRGPTGRILFPTPSSSRKVQPAQQPAAARHTPTIRMDRHGPVPKAQNRPNKGRDLREGRDLAETLFLPSPVQPT